MPCLSTCERTRLQALQRLGILDEVLAASITGQHGGAGSFNVWDADWNPILRMKPPKTPPDSLPAPAMRIARYILRQHLIDALPESVQAHWGVGCTSAAVLEDGRMRVTLTDGSSSDCDLLVAAGDLRAGALLADLGPEVDAQLPRGLARLGERFDGDDPAHAHVHGGEVVEVDLGAHAPDASRSAGRARRR